MSDTLEISLTIDGLFAIDALLKSISSYQCDENCIDPYGLQAEASFSKISTATTTTMFVPENHS